MRSALPVVALAAIVALAIALREAAAPGHRHAPREGDPAPAWLVDDPDAAYHLRRTELALASGEVPREDRFLAHPRGSAVPWPPLADGAFALVARALARTPAGERGDPALGGFQEERVEAVLVHAPPALGALTAAAVLALVLACTDRGRGRMAAALAAALVYACVPSAVWYSEVTRLDHHVLEALLLAVVLVLSAWALRARELVDATTCALLGGVAAGAGMLTWLAFGIHAGLAGGAFFAASLAGTTEERRTGARSGGLFFAAAAVTVMVPAARSPWNDVRPHSLLELTDGVPLALAAAAAPFAAAALMARAGRSRLQTALVGAALVGALALALPGFSQSLRDGLAWSTRENQFMDVVGESRPLGRDALRRLSPALLLFPIAWLALLPTARRPDRLLLLLSAAVTCAMALVQQRFANGFAVPMSAVIGVALAEGLRSPRARVRRLALAGALAAAAAALLAAGGVALVPRAEYRELARWRAEVLRGLRWMRAGTPSSGPWNAPAHPQSYGVLAPWSLGHLIEYHARRPAIATNFGSYVGERGFRGAAEALLETDPVRLAGRMHELGARYLVVAPRFASDLASTARVAGREPSAYFRRMPGGGKAFSEGALRTALWRLAVHEEPAGSTSYPGLRLAWRAERLETPRQTLPAPGEPAGPVLSVWELVEPPADREPPTMGPPPEAR